MSKFRPTLVDSDGKSPCPTDGTAYLMILNAVKQQAGLIHGKLDGAYGEHCAIGSYFDINSLTALKFTLIDEVAMVNDSMPTATPRERKLHMERWLKWRLAQVGMPGYENAVKPKK